LSAENLGKPRKLSRSRTLALSYPAYEASGVLRKEKNMTEGSISKITEI
jgi:hypothetical protein